MPVRASVLFGRYVLLFILQKNAPKGAMFLQLCDFRLERGCPARTTRKTRAPFSLVKPSLTSGYCLGRKTIGNQRTNVYAQQSDLRWRHD